MLVVEIQKHNMYIPFALVRQEENREDSNQSSHEGQKTTLWSCISAVFPAYIRTIRHGSLEIDKNSAISVQRNFIDKLLCFCYDVAD